MKASIRAGIAYFGIVFALGFVLGTIRTLIVLPRLGELAGVLLELPLILVCAWFVCRWLIIQYRVPVTLPSRTAMAGLAFVLLMAAELGLSVGVFNHSIREHLEHYVTAAGALGLIGHILFAAFPLLQLTRQQRD